MHRETAPSPGVIPRVSPTVPTAEAVSNRQATSGRLSSRLMARPLMKNRSTYIITMAAALRTASSPIFRPKHVVSSFLRNTDSTVRTMTATVVVFRPPAVDPGDPPMSMHRIMTACPPALIPFRSTVLKPAVRSVTDWNRLGSPRRDAGRALISKKKNHKKGSRTSRAEVVSTILLCIRYCLKRMPWSFTSFHTRKPMPPTVIKRITVTLTRTLPENPVREENGPRIPIRSKPALQKAETEWNTAYQMPLPHPNSGMKAGSSSKAPESSITKAAMMMNRVRRTIPPTWGADMDSRMTLRCIRPMRRPEMNERDNAAVTTPMPPIWIRVRITACPKADQ